MEHISRWNFDPVGESRCAVDGLGGLGEDRLDASLPCGEPDPDVGLEPVTWGRAGLGLSHHCTLIDATNPNCSLQIWSHQPSRSLGCPDSDEDVYR